MQSIVTLTITDLASITQLTVNTEQVSVVLTIEDARGAPGASAYQEWLAQGNSGSVEEFLAALVSVSTQPSNRLRILPDGLHVLDELTPDPLAYYILSRS